MQIKSGQRLRSQVDATEVIVVRAVAGEVDLRCGGAPLIDIKDTPDPSATATSDAGGGAALGKRYTDGSQTLEILATKSGAHALTLGEQPLALKEAKPLPSSD